MFCGKCGFPIKDGDKFCSNCSNAVVPETKIETPPVAEPEVVQPQVDIKVATESVNAPLPPVYPQQPINPGYPVPPAPCPYPPKKPNKTCEILSFIFGILSIATCLGGIFTAVPALVLGIIARKSNKSDLSLIGIILGAIGIGLAIITIIFYLILILSLDSGFYSEFSNYGLY